MFTFLRFRCLAVAHILTHSVHLALGAKWGNKHKCEVRACDFWFRLKIKAHLQIWVAGRLHFDKGLQFCLTEDLKQITYLNIVKIKLTLRH